jgi:hypothetical protein
MSCGASSNEGDAGGAASDARCMLAWGTPTDPGYRGLRGTLNGQALSVDGTDVRGGIAFNFANGPGPAPEPDDIYIPLPGLSLWLERGCGARVTSPDDTIWHELDIQLSGSVAKPVSSNIVVGNGQPGFSATVMSGHVRLEGQALDGPVSLDADFCLDANVADSCAPPPPRVD